MSRIPIMGAVLIASSIVLGLDQAWSSELARGSGYVIEMIPPQGSLAGEEAILQVVLHPSEGHKVNVDFPISLELVAPDGVGLAKPKQEKGDAKKLDAKEARFEARFTAVTAGRKTFVGLFRFAVCTDKTCEPRREKLSFTVEVRK
ncbi:MAG: hypothetical protein HY698_21405 [Deltaproteobacteria bacterium]|nr:hypothetical protein [Deltaproteobacteria bacterium]